MRKVRGTPHGVEKYERKDYCAASLGFDLKKIRQHYGLTQRALSWALVIKASRIKNAECDKKMPRSFWEFLQRTFKDWEINGRPYVSIVDWNKTPEELYSMRIRKMD